MISAMSTIPSEIAHTSGYPFGSRKASGMTDCALDFGVPGVEMESDAYSVKANLASLGGRDCRSPFGVVVPDMRP